MKQIITSTIQRVINKTMEGFSAKLVEDLIQYHIAVKGPNQFLNVFVFIRNGEAVIEIESDYHNYVMHYEMAMSLESLVRNVLIDLWHIDMELPSEEEYFEPSF